MNLTPRFSLYIHDTVCATNLRNTFAETTLSSKLLQRGRHDRLDSVHAVLGLVEDD